MLPIETIKLGIKPIEKPDQVVMKPVRSKNLFLKHKGQHSLQKAENSLIDHMLKKLLKHANQSGLYHLSLNTTDHHHRQKSNLEFI